MTTRKCHPRASGPVAIAAVLVLALCTSAASAARTLSPLPASDYGVRALCSAPEAGDAGCLALQLLPRTTQAREHTHPLGMPRPAPAPATAPPAAGEIGLRPQDLHLAYSLPTEASTPQAIAIVDAYNDPSAEADLASYDEEFGLPACTTGNGCFTQVNQNGKGSPLPFPKSKGELETARSGGASERKAAEIATGWDGEISLDIETAHATCENCAIILVEAETAAGPNLETAERSAEKLGASEISNSWGGPELGETPEVERTSPFDDPGTVITASAGDDGYLSWDAARSSERGYASFPASSPHVVAVGGTRLEIGSGGAWVGESVWNGDGAGGGGCSTIFEAPLWQQNVSGFSKVGCHRDRAVADISADADPYTGVAVRDSSPNCSSEYAEGGKVHELAHWCTIGGTSLSAPLIAATFALAGGAKGAPYPARTLYQNALSASSALHDVTSGSNGECLSPFVAESGLSGCTLAEEAASCQSKRICLAGSGYDGPSGLGTPHGVGAFVRSPEDEAAAEEVRPPEEPEESETWSPGSGEHGETGGGETVTHNPTPTVGSSPSPTPEAPVALLASTPLPHLSSLSLTRTAVIALNRARPPRSTVGFAFTLNTPARVRAVLTRQVRRHGHAVWVAAGAAFVFAAPAGHGTRRLPGRASLPMGVYRLTLSVGRGGSRSISFDVG